MRRLQVIALALVCARLLGCASQPLAAQQTNPPVAQAGPYKVGRQVFDFVDKSRSDRSLPTYVWYPAQESKDEPVAPDMSGAPYPLVFYSHGWTGRPDEEIADGFIKHLVSQGFVVAAIDHNDRGERWPALHSMVDRPFDILYVLDQLSELKERPLVGVVNTDNVGIIGYSLGGYTTITVAGARIDYKHLTDWCAGTPGRSLFNYCSFMSSWGLLTQYRKGLVPESKDELWTATTDKRIHAIFTLAPCGGPFWGERGLATVTVPSLIVAGTEDIHCPYDIDASYINDHLGSADHYLVTLSGRDHLEVPEKEVISFYEAAFFGYYLQGKTDDAQYLMPESAERFSNVTLKADVGGSKTARARR